MKRGIAFALILIIVSTIGLSFDQAGSEAAGPPGGLQVDVSNTPLSVTGSVSVQNTPLPVAIVGQTGVNVVGEPTTPRNVNVTNSTPIPVTITDGSTQKKFVSGYVMFNLCPGCPAPTSHTLLTVTEDKLFFLTDIVVHWYGEELYINILENDATRFSLGFDSRDPITRAFHFDSGIPFSSGRNVNVYSDNYSAVVRVMICGYEISGP